MEREELIKRVMKVMDREMSQDEVGALLDNLFQSWGLGILKDGIFTCPELGTVVWDEVLVDEAREVERVHR